MEPAQELSYLVLLVSSGVRKDITQKNIIVFTKQKNIKSLRDIHREVAQRCGCTCKKHCVRGEPGCIKIHIYMITFPTAESSYN